MNEASPLITAIIPTYRRPQLLRRAVRSVLNQTYTRLQVCVYDNASHDETESVVAELAKMDLRVKYYCQPHNIGPYPNYQYGMDHVDTPFFSMLGDDDVLLPDFYRVAMSGFEQHPQAFCSLCGAINVDDRGRVWLVQGTDWRPGLYPPPTGFFAITERGTTPPWACFVCRREVLEVTGPLDESVGNAADWDFEYRLAALRPLVMSTQPGVIIVSHGAAESMKGRQKLTWARWNASAKLTEKICHDERIPDEARDFFRNLRTVAIPKTLFRNYWLRGTLSGEWMFAYRAAVMYRFYGFGFRAWVLTVANKVIRGVPLGRRLLGVLYRFFIRVRDLRPSQAGHRSEDYTRFLVVEQPAEGVHNGSIRPYVGGNIGADA